MAFKLLNQATAIGSSLAVKVPKGTTKHFVEVFLESTTTTKISVVELKLQGGFDNPKTSLSTAAVLGIGSTAQRVKNTNAFYYMIDGTNYTIAAGAAGTVHTGTNGVAITAAITDAKYGGLNVYANTSGALVTNPPPNYGRTTLQAFDDAATCLAALKLAETPKNCCLLGREVVLCSTAFTWGTTALTGVATFYDEYPPFYDLDTYTFDATDLTNQRAAFTTTDVSAEYVRVYLSALTGTGYITVKYTPIEG